MREGLFKVTQTNDQNQSLRDRILEPHDCADLVQSLYHHELASFFGSEPEHFDASGVR